MTRKAAAVNNGICLVNQIVEDFQSSHLIEIKSKGVFHNWNSIWVIDGQTMRSEMVKRLLIPTVMETIGPDPKALKQIMWRILSLTGQKQAIYA